MLQGACSDSVRAATSPPPSKGQFAYCPFKPRLESSLKFRAEEGSIQTNVSVRQMLVLHMQVAYGSGDTLYSAFIQRCIARRSTGYVRDPGIP